MTTERASPSLIAMDRSRLGNRPLILGASGQLGSAMTKLFSQALTPTRADLDLLDLDVIQRTLEALAPSSIINCAAWTAVDAAEDDEEAATALNALAVERLADFCGRQDIPFLTFSTDYVFDGTATMPYVESAPRAPINAYGRSKARGEELAAATYPDTLIVRTSWVISDTHESFLSKILTRAAGGTLSRVVDDQVGRPTTASDLARASLQALTAGTTGLLHVAGTGHTSWFELARYSVLIAGFDTDLILPCSTEDYPTRAARPKYSVLGTERATDQPPPLSPWKTAIQQLVPAILDWLSQE
jgi:dTDP-4-dehydrorhamnose reductase